MLLGLGAAALSAVVWHLIERPENRDASTTRLASGPQTFKVGRDELSRGLVLAWARR